MENFEIKDTEFEVDGERFSADSISYEYQQQDGENSGRSDDGTMYRDVVGLLNKVSYDFVDYRGLENISKILKLLEKTSCELKYFDLKEMKFVEKNMNVTGDAVKAKKINGEMTAEPFQIRFIQMTVDDIG